MTQMVEFEQVGDIAVPADHWAGDAGVLQERFIAFDPK